MFAQETIKVDDVGRELKEVQSAVGSGVDVERFLATAIQLHRGVADGTNPTRFDLKATPRSLRDALGFPYEDDSSFTARFQLPVQKNEVYLTRTHPIVEGLASYVLDTALDPLGSTVASRAGVIRSKGVQTRTTLLLLRLRYHIIIEQPVRTNTLLAEACRLAAFEGSPRNAQWLTDDKSEALLQFKSDVNVSADVATNSLRGILSDFESLVPQLEKIAHTRGQELLESHRRVRASSRQKGLKYNIEPKLPVDVLGVYVFLPVS